MKAGQLAAVLLPLVSENPLDMSTRAAGQRTSGSLLPGGCPTRSWNAPTPAIVTHPLSLFSLVGSKWSSTTLS
jgi:hypothetical protein